MPEQLLYIDVLINPDNFPAEPGTVSSKTSSKILFYSKKEYIFQPDQMGLILKTKDAQQSHRNSTRTEYILKI
jgi:hypothetical protein